MIVTIDVPDALLDSLRRFYPLWQQDEAGTLPEDSEDELNDLYEELGPVALQRLAVVVVPPSPTTRTMSRPRLALCNSVNERLSQILGRGAHDTVA